MLAGVATTSAQTAWEQAKAAAVKGDLVAAAGLYEKAIAESPKNKDLLVEAGDVYNDLEKHDRARDLYASAHDLDSRDQGLTRKYAAALSATNDCTRAAALLVKLVRDEGSLENYLALGQIYIACGKDSLARAELTLQTASQKYPKSADVAVALGDLYFAREVYELAQTKYEDALAIDDKLIEPRIRLGRSYRELAKRAPSDAEANDLYNKALLEFNRATAMAPRQPRPWLEQGEIFMLAHLYEKAGQSFTEYVNLRSDDPRGYLMLARAAYDGHFYVQAISPLEWIVARTDDFTKPLLDRARFMLGKSYYANKDYAKARAMYESANDSVFDADGRKLYASSLLLSGGDTTKAADLYRRLIEADPSDCSLSMGLGSLMYSRKQYDEVIDIYTKRLATCPNEPKATPYLYIGLSHFAKGRYDEAVTALENSVAADSSSAQAFYWLMNVYAKKEQYGKAADIARVMAARGMDKTNAKEVATGYFFGGVERFKAKDYRGALAEFERVIRLNSENAQAYLYSAFSYQLLNDKENACKFYRLTLKYDPKNADAQKNLKAVGCS